MEEMVALLPRRLHGLREPVGRIKRISYVCGHGVGVFLNVVCYPATIVHNVLRHRRQLTIC